MKNKNFVNKIEQEPSKIITNIKRDKVIDKSTILKNFVQNEVVVTAENLDILRGNGYFNLDRIREKIRCIRSMENKDVRDLSTLNINIITWADVDQRTYMCWGDYWVKERLTRYLREYFKSVNVDHNLADISLYLFGSPFKPGVIRAPYNPMTFNVAWLYSHPDKFDGLEALKYDLVMCLSKQYVNEVKKIHNNVHDTAIISCSDFTIPNIDYGSDNSLVMVANARGNMPGYGRGVVEYLVQLKNELESTVKVWGHKWENREKYNLFPAEWYVGKYIDYNELNSLYRGSKAVIIDGHGTMEDNGFVPMKLFDVFASGGLPIIRYNSGINDIFGEYVLQYNNAEELKRCINVTRDREKCLEIIKLGNEVALKNTYYHRVKEIIEIIRKQIVIFNEENKLTSSKPVSVPKREIVWVND